MDAERILERERHQMQQIRELDLEELIVEDISDSSSNTSNDARDGGHRGDATSSEFTFNTCLASLHTYLGEVEDTHHRLAFLDGGAILNLPLFYVEGVVLFPEATLPLRVLQPNFIAAIERLLSQDDAPCTIGVVRVYRDPDNGRIKSSNVGTTAEIRQYRRLEDGSLNVVTRGQQRFRLRRRWIDVEGAPCGEVQIIQEDSPLRTPRDAFGKLGPLCNLHRDNPSCTSPLNASRSKRHRLCADDEDSEDSFENELSLSERRLHHSAVDSCYGHDVIDESTSSDDDKFTCPSDLESSRPNEERSEDFGFGNVKISISGKQSGKGVRWRKGWMNAELNSVRRVPRAFLPYWVYRMYDSYSLAQRAADIWKQVVGTPSMDAVVKKPDLLSFYIASKIPVSESTRQELLEIDGISYRLRREIELLESFDRVRCKHCQTVIARRSNMLVMSNEGPLGAYVNPHGFVHEVMTLYKAKGLAVYGSPVTEYSWFPGYAWSVTNCATCETQMGWLFTATNNKLKPKSFWGIRSSQVADDMR